MRFTLLGLNIDILAMRGRSAATQRRQARGRLIAGVWKSPYSRRVGRALRLAMAAR